MYCVRCGAEVPLGAKVCGKCGKATQVYEAPTAMAIIAVSMALLGVVLMYFGILFSITGLITGIIAFRWAGNRPEAKINWGMGLGAMLLGAGVLILWLMLGGIIALLALAGPEAW